MKRSVLAIAAHPDDIEFVMTGTMIRLREAGWDLHYFNVANGCCGSMTMPPDEVAEVRLSEAKQAAERLGATFYPPICNDLEVFYEKSLMEQVLAVVRQAAPSIILTHSPQDYMEDHQNACRLAVFGAFARRSPNFPAEPNVAPISGDVAVYHAQPHGNCDPLRQPIRPDYAIDVADTLDEKRQLLGFHQSQADWLDETQGMGSYVETMQTLGEEVGKLCGQQVAAEGWRLHQHFGLGPADFDPLREQLTRHVLPCPQP